MYTNATDIDPGDIVWVANPTSSSGKPTYSHRFVVVFRPRLLSRGEKFRLVGIASCNDATFDPSSMVRLPFIPHSASGHQRTGLKTDSAAHVDFVHSLPIEFVEGQRLLQVQCKLDVSKDGLRRHVSAAELQAIDLLFRKYWGPRVERRQ